MPSIETADSTTVDVTADATATSTAGISHADAKELNVVSVDEITNVLKQVTGNLGVLGMIGVLSVFETISASIKCDDMEEKKITGCDGKTSYAVAVGAISIVTCMGLYAGIKYKPDMFKRSVRSGFAIFLFVWWGLGACILTFDEPFKRPTNGYFSSWGAFGFSLVYMMRTLTAFTGKVGNMLVQLKNHTILYLLSCVMIASIIELIAAFQSCKYQNYSDCPNEWKFGVAAGSVSIIVSIGGIITYVTCCKKPSNMHQLAMAQFGIGLVLAVWWVVSWGMLTFENGLFENLGNGYFSCWAAMLAASYLLLASWSNLKPSLDAAKEGKKKKESGGDEEEPINS